MDEKDFHWLIGILEGEGCFMKAPPSQPGSPRIVLRMCCKDVVRRAANLLGVKSITMIPTKNPKRRSVFEFRLTSKKAIYFMEKVYPYMGERQQQRIKKALPQK